MDLNLNISLSSGYKSNLQIARVLTENWINENMFCPCCENKYITKFDNNNAVADFFCPTCKREYELKSKSAKFGEKVVDGAYSTMIKKVNTKTNPDFFFMSYSKEKSEVTDFFIIPRYFFTPKIIIERKPLALTARRAGWVGCNINIGAIPLNGRIYVIENQNILSRKSVIQQFNKMNFLETETVQKRSWILDVLNCINRIKYKEFMLSDVYNFEHELANLHPDNHNIRPKIRQQLQYLRDKNIIEFLKNGKYRKIGNYV